MPADAYWNLAMAVNVYLNLFKKYNAQQLKAVEWRYHLACYGGPFVVALTLLFVETQSRGKVYGDATVRYTLGFHLRLLTHDLSCGAGYRSHGTTFDLWYAMYQHGGSSP